ncbi:hypothetical protein NVP1047O_09 [Vibrio phage 1.047.O._10N.286.55.F2]|nr:hypothetical protein NVP1047O_09 [Vibrio phage 1.047.O._10N.286.55.F2]
MKNKRVKQMICDIWDEKQECKFPFGHYFELTEGLYVCFINGWGPDNYYEDAEKLRLGTVSLTADQLRGVR